MKKYNLKFAFTLAEVQVTLAIVGVIASLTIPNLLLSVDSAQTTAKLRKFYSTISQAFTLINNENMGMESLYTPASFNAPFYAFATKLNVIKSCGSATGCLYTTATKKYNGLGMAANFELNASPPSTPYSGKAIMTDGAMIIIKNGTDKCTWNSGTGPLLNSVCGYIVVDLNGANPPNTYGKDIFQFFVAKTGIYPQGGNGDGSDCSNWGLGCATKVLAGQ